MTLEKSRLFMIEKSRPLVNSALPNNWIREQCLKGDGRMNGVVARIVREKGFGFIQGEDGEEYFFHKAETVTAFNLITEGSKVSFEKDKGPKGLRAANVKLVE